MPASTGQVLARIEARLRELYDLEPGPPVVQFVCDAETVRASGAEPERGEVLLVLEDDQGVHLGLYVDPAAVHAIQHDPDPWQRRFGAASLATEGVSHFVYLTFRATNAEPVSALELELQAEVDKYAVSLLAGWGVGAIRERSRLLRRRLYAEARLRDKEGTPERERYELALRLADRYAQRLEERFVARGDRGAFVRELRRFYRLGLRGKLEAATR
ncbi:MAG: hypothetical protein NZ898_15865 [Myxococcota bacterium]|nr:hypothetical protein [Myxococcota bacterium]MDW8363979.1 hypothetical protein [Myxococcales bacterium]